MMQFWRDCVILRMVPAAVTALLVVACCREAISSKSMNGWHVVVCSVLVHVAHAIPHFFNASRLCHEQVTRAVTAEQQRHAYDVDEMMRRERAMSDRIAYLHSALEATITPAPLEPLVVPEATRHASRVIILEDEHVG